MPKKETNNKNHTARVGVEFTKELIEIQEARLESNIDKKKKSIRKLTDLIPHHHHWAKIKADMEKINLEKKHNE
jgi:hypothetical protein